MALSELSELFVKSGIFDGDLVDAIRIAFKEIEITEEVIAQRKDDPNFEIINFSLMPYDSPFLYDVPDWLYRDHVEEIADRLGKIRIDMKKKEIEEIMAIATDAELVNVASQASLVNPIRYEYGVAVLEVFNRICKRQGLENRIIDVPQMNEKELSDLEIEMKSMIKNKDRVDEVWKVVKELRKKKGEKQ